MFIGAPPGSLMLIKRLESTSPWIVNKSAIERQTKTQFYIHLLYLNISNEL